MEPSPECQALCVQSVPFPQPIGCERTTPLQNRFRDILGTKRCNEWREQLQPNDDNSFIIKPQMVEITPTKRQPCHY